MSSRTSAYLLRPNKTVDRLLFADLLARLDAALKIGERYSYVGMGGDYMEDFRLLHERFPRMRMISLEERLETSKRQKFNRPHSAITFLHQSSGEWIEQSLPGNTPQVIWLDFQGKQRAAQIEQFQSLVTNVARPSILRLTLDVSPETLGGNTLPKDKIERLRSQLGPLLPDDVSPADFIEGGRGFEGIMREAVTRAATQALKNQRSMRFQPLLVIAYKDTSRMLTMTGLVIQREELDSVIDKAGLRDWEFSWLKRESILKIELPELSTRERLTLNQMLPAKAKRIAQIHKKFGFWFGEDEAQSESSLANYIQFAGMYPQFARVTV